MVGSPRTIPSRVSFDIAPRLMLTFCSDEHQRRSPDCIFFSLSASSQTTKTVKDKKSRTSKTSRMSMQSHFSLASEGPSVMEVDPFDESMVSVAESVKTAKSSKGGKKGKKTKAQPLLPKQDDTQLSSSFVEPEDDDFEVKVVKPAVTKAKGKKRNSEEMNGVAEISSKITPKKRRTTRTRNSVASVQAAPEVTVETEQPELDQDVEMANAETISLPSKPASKKKGKGSKKRGSSAARKASSKSIASEASLRVGMPNDEDIDAALEEDLDRPLTDDGEDDELETIKPPKGRSLTRSKPGSKATDASTAPTRRTTRTSTITGDDSVAEPYSIISAARESGKQLAEDVEKSSAKPLPKAEASKKIGTRKASAKQKARDQEAETGEELPADSNGELDILKPKQTRGRKLSHQVLNGGGHMSNIQASQADSDMISKADSSVVDIQGQEDKSDHGTDAKTSGRSKRGKKASTAKKTKGGKKTGPKSRTIEDVVQPAVADQLVSELQDETVALADNVDDPEPAVEEQKKPAKKQTKAAKARPNAKGKKATPNPIEAEEAAVQKDVSEPKGPVEVPPLSPAASVHSTPRPAPSPQSSDAENQPPSSRPSRSQEFRVPLAVITTPSVSPSKGNFAKLQSSFPWTTIDIDQILRDTPDVEKENQPFANNAKLLTSPEKKLSVEEWIKFNAQRGEEKLRNDCERLVGKFEDQGVRALKTLEGIICID